MMYAEVCFKPRTRSQSSKWLMSACDPSETSPFADAAFEYTVSERQMEGGNHVAAGRLGQTRIGVLTPHADIGPETELNALAPDGISIHAAHSLRQLRAGGTMDPTLATDPIRAVADPSAVDDAAEMLAMDRCMRSFLASPAAATCEAPPMMKRFKSRLERRTRGIPVIVTCAAALAAMAALSDERIGLINRPWFSDETDQRGAGYFRNQGIEVVYSGPADLPSDQQTIQSDQVYDWVRSHVTTNAEGVFIGGNGLRAIGVIKALEDSLDRPVLTANKVAFWCALRRARVRATVTGYDRIFEFDLPRS